MVVLGVIVFLAGLVALYSAITDQSVASLVKQIIGGETGG